MTSVRLEKVTKAYDVVSTDRWWSLKSLRFRNRSHEAVHAVGPINLSIQEHEFFTFVGPSGCGKSTILNLIAGLETTSAGTIYFDDHVMNAVDPKDRDIAMVFQSYALYPHMSVFENVAFPLRVQKRPRVEIERAVHDIATTLGIEEFLRRRPRELSGGQRQRVALARALVRRPRVFLMDEPLSNLDARLRIDMRSELKRLRQKWPVTTVYVTHDQEEAMALSDRVAVMFRGQLQQCASPEEIYSNPANQFVAEFIGSPPINFLPGDRLAMICANQLVNPDSRQLFQRFALNDRFVCGVRPEDLVVQSHNPTEAGGGVAGVGGVGQKTDEQAHSIALLGKVLSLELTGRDEWATIEVGGTQLKGRASRADRVLLGASVLAVVPFERLLWFDANTGNRMEHTG